MIARFGFDLSTAVGLESSHGTTVLASSRVLSPHTTTIFPLLLSELGLPLPHVHCLSRLEALHFITGTRWPAPPTFRQVAVLSNKRHHALSVVFFLIATSLELFRQIVLGNFCLSKVVDITVPNAECVRAEMRENYHADDPHATTTSPRQAPP